jgi:hypothetical protein
MSSWTTNPDSSTIPIVDAIIDGADPAASDIGSTPEAEVSSDGANVAGQIADMQSQMKSMQESHQTQMNAMMQTMASALRGSGQPSDAPAPMVAPPITVPELDGLDDDEPLAAPLRGVAQRMAEQQAHMNQAIAQLASQMQEMNLSRTRDSLSGQVDAALGSHGVPKSLQDMVRTTVYAYMARGGETADANALVKDFMQAVGQHDETQKKSWAEEARRPRPLGSIGTAPGVQFDKPKSWEEAKQASLAMLRAARPMGSA